MTSPSNTARFLDEVTARVEARNMDIFHERALRENARVDLLRTFRERKDARYALAAEDDNWREDAEIEFHERNEGVR